jgi:hypothetical protein
MSTPTFHGRFEQLHYNNQRQGLPLHRPHQVEARPPLVSSDAADDPDFVAQCCAEKQRQNNRGRWFRPDESEGPNH